MKHFAGFIKGEKSKGQGGPGVVQFGPFKFLPATHELFKGRHKIPLKVQSARVLSILLENKGELVTRPDLIRRIWPDRHVEYDLSLNSCLRDIRNALKDNPKSPVYIETLSKRGYRFIGPVTVQPLGPALKFPPVIKKTILGFALAVGAFFTVLHFAYPYLFETGQGTQTAKGEVSEEARALLLAGVSALYDREVPETREALSYFTQAVAAEPGFIEAYIMTARTISARGSAEDAEKGLEAIDRILELDPKNSEALMLQGAIRWSLRYDLDGARQSFEALLKADPDSSQGYSGLSGYYLVMGDGETALAYLQQALDRNPIRLTESGLVGWYHYLAGHYLEGLAYCQETLSVNPENPEGHRCLVNNLLALGDAEKAAQNALSFLLVSGVPKEDMAALDTANPGAVLDFMFGLEAKGERPGRFSTGRLDQAVALVRLGEKDQALAILDQAYAERNFFFPFISVIPEFKNLAENPDFKALMSGARGSPGPLNS